MKEVNNSLTIKLFKKTVIIAKKKNRNPSLELKPKKRSKVIVPENLFTDVKNLIRNYVEECPKRKHLLEISNEDVVLGKIYERIGKNPNVFLVKTCGMSYVVNLSKKTFSTFDPINTENNHLNKVRKSSSSSIESQH